MKDEDKTKKQLLDELIRMRRRMAELEEAEKQRKQVEEARQQSESKYRKLFDQATDGIMMMPVGGTNFTVNESFAKLHGYGSPKDMEHLTLSDLDTPETARLAPERLHRLLTGESMNFEVEHYHKNGHKVLLNVSCNLIQIGGESYFLGFHQDITHRKRAEEALRESEERHRRLFETMAPGVVYHGANGAILSANPSAERILGLSLDQMVGKTPMDPDWQIIREDGSEFPGTEHPAMVALRTGNPIGPITMGVFHPSENSHSWLSVTAIPLFQAEESTPSQVYTTFEDITKRKQAETFLRIQHDLALALGSTNSMVDALTQLLDAAMKIDGFDSGGVYVVEQGTGSLSLISHIGLSSSFVAKVSHYAPESPQARLVMQGEPTYWPNARGGLGIGRLLEKEGLTSVAVIPVKFGGNVIAVLNLASKMRSEISESARGAIETIAAQIGGVVSRVNMVEELKLERKNLAEANAALKVLLRQRAENCRELEESLLTNVKNLVLPFAEKLKNTRLTLEQVLFLEIVESHLKEITSPFLRTLSRQFAELTPMEIRVADLVRDGRTSKEIAQILHIAENSVLFHRKNVRRKLGLKSKKANLNSYLKSLS